MIVIADTEKYKDKEALYINVRSKEGRVITDEELSMLPNVSENNKQYKEWELRSYNLNRLKKYLSAKKKPLHILDIGCGNGWMSHHLCKEGHIVTGIDLNMAELQQAERTFEEHERLQWVYADILEDKLPYKADIVLFAASIQYFESIVEVTRQVKPLLKGDGEIHLFDSIFYKNAEEADKARLRSHDYYTSLGYAAMSQNYYHHCIDTLKQARYMQIMPRIFERKGVLQWWYAT